MGILRTLLIVSLAYAQQALGSYEVEDFNTRAANIENLRAIYDQLINTSIYKVEARNALMDQFMKTFENTFNNTDTWLNNAILDGNLAYNYIIEVGYNRKKIEDFLTRVTIIEKTAIDMNFLYNSGKDNRPKAVELVQFKQTVNDKFQNITSEILNNLNWETDIKKDIDDWASQKDADLDSLISLLKTKYKNGNWLVLQYKTGDLKKQCQENTFRVTLKNRASKMTTMVVMSTPGKDDLAKASIYQRKISDYYKNLKELSNEKYDCWTKDIEEMSSYKCSTNTFSFFGTFGVEQIVNLGSTKEELLSKATFSTLDKSACKGFSLIFA